VIWCFLSILSQKPELALPENPLTRGMPERTYIGTSWQPENRLAILTALDNVMGKTGHNYPGLSGH
jgi:hypothetical protein